jgi:hypothetical protein
MEKGPPPADLCRKNAISPPLLEHVEISDLWALQLVINATDR